LKFIQEGTDSIVVSCKNCSKQHIIKKLHYFKTSLDYRLIKAIHCDCGNISDNVEVEKITSVNPASNESMFSLIFKLILYLSIPVIIIILLFKGCSAILNSSYEKKDFNDITREEYNDFMEWDRKQQDKKWDNEKMFGN
jgi:hypothetical protein